MTPCEHESKIAPALASGELPRDLRQHVESCPECREAFSVARRLQKMAEGFSEQPLHSAECVWWRLSVRLRREQADRAQRPLVWMQRIFAATIALVCAALLGLAWRDYPSDVWTTGLAALGAVAIPATIALWSWSRARS